MNVQATEAGAIVKRTGFATFASPAVTLTSLFPLESVSPVLLIGAGGTSLYSISTGGAVTAIKTGLTNNVRWEGVSAPVVSTQGPAFLMNGTDVPQQGNGATLANWTNASGSVAVPNGKYMTYFQNQVFVAGLTAAPSGLTLKDPKSAVVWSAIADATNFDPASLTGAGFLEFDPNDGAAITAIGVAGPYVFVFKPRKTWVITSVANATSRMISNTVGAAAHRSLAQSPQGLIFLSEDRGCYVSNGSTVEPLNDAIDPTFKSITSGQRAQAAGVFYDRHYYLSVPLTSATNDTILDFDTTLGSWWRHSQGSNQLAPWHQSAGQVGLYSAKSTSAIVDQCFVAGLYTDNGNPMTWVWRSAWESPVFYRHKFYNTPYYRKRLRQVRCDGQGTVDFSLAKDFAGAETLIEANALAPASGPTVWGASDGSVWGGIGIWGPPSVQRNQFYSLGVANAFSVVFGATSSTADAVFSYILLVTPLRDLVVSS